MQRQLSVLRMIRQIFFPTHVFHEALVLRGTLTNMPQIMISTGQHAAAIIWKKNCTVKRMWAAALEDLDFKTFDPVGSSIIIYYNPEGSSPVPGNQSFPPSSPTMADVDMPDAGDGGGGASSSNGPSGPSGREPPGPPPWTHEEEKQGKRGPGVDFPAPSAPQPAPSSNLQPESGIMRLNPSDRSRSSHSPSAPSYSDPDDILIPSGRDTPLTSRSSSSSPSGRTSSSGRSRSRNDSPRQPDQI